MNDPPRAIFSDQRALFAQEHQGNKRKHAVRRGREGLPCEFILPSGERCGRQTSGGKYGCIDHLAALHPYYAQVIAEESEREHERQSRKRPLAGDRLVEDARVWVEHHGPDVERLAWVLVCEQDYASQILRLLERKAKASVRTPRRSA